MRSELVMALRRLLFVVGLASGLQGKTLSAQTPSPVRTEATRAELETIAAHPPKGMSAADLAAVQSRLQNGDFAVGDRILIQVQGETTLSNTYTVGGNRTIVLPSLPPLSLVGVLRSESDSVVREFIGHYIRDPQVTVQALIRLGVLGGVAKPGYYDVSAQSLLSEVVMEAGGMGGTGRMDKTTVYRGNTEVLDPKAVNLAITNGTTLDLLNLQSGDNLNVGMDKASGALTKVQIITGLLAIPIMIFTITAIAGN
jgi:protein involved in polysaccharide export with SLBB domain